MSVKQIGGHKTRLSLLIQLFLPYLDDMEAQLSVQGGMGSTEVDLELVLHESDVRGKRKLLLLL